MLAEKFLDKASIITWSCDKYIFIMLVEFLKAWEVLLVACYPTLQCVPSVTNICVSSKSGELSDLSAQSANKRHRSEDSMEEGKSAYKGLAVLADYGDSSSDDDT